MATGLSRFTAALLLQRLATITGVATSFGQGRCAWPSVCFFFSFFARKKSGSNFRIFPGVKRNPKGKPQKPRGPVSYFKPPPSNTEGTSFALFFPLEPAFFPSPLPLSASKQFQTQASKQETRCTPYAHPKPTPTLKQPQPTSKQP